MKMNVFRLRLVHLPFLSAVIVTVIIFSFRMITEISKELSRSEAFQSDSWFLNCENDQTLNVNVCGKEFTILQNVLVDKLSGKNLEEKDPKPSFTLKCDSVPNVVFHKDNHLNDWYDNVRCSKYDVGGTKSPTVQHLTIMVRRYEYANLYHTMTDFYNAFILMKVLNSSPNVTNIILWDHHPKGLLDDIWRVLFKDVFEISYIKQKTFFSKLVWGIIGYNSPLSAFNLPSIPYVEEFRNFFLERYGISPISKLMCDHLSILFIWRHDYVAHPGNPTGLIHRKILNEEEILKTSQKILQGHNIKGVQLDLLSMKDQLKLITNTDIVIGMHGAGLTNAIFLPQHSGLIELFPYSHLQFKITGTFVHFESIARWRKLEYMAWKNPDKENQFQKFYTKIQPVAIINLITDMKNKICSK